MPQQTVVSIFVAKCASIDPNISHTYNDLDNGIILVSDVDTINDDAAKFFGTPLDVLMHDYLYDDIKRDCGFSRQPRFVGMSCGGYMFYDGDRARVIMPEKIEHYMNIWSEHCLAYERGRSWRIVDNDNLIAYLKQSFVTGGGAVFSKGSTRLLSATQIKEIDKIVKNLKLSSLYDSENPNIFVCIQ